ncbi:MAG: Histidine kinase [Pedosphaera sp.]|nr:Histidine kinase [Pedosphaera sp.]
MARPNQDPKPTFFWQGLLIVLPVIGLAVVGFLSLRQDRSMAEAEARQRANELADSLMSAIQQQFGFPRLQANPIFSNPNRLEEEVQKFLASSNPPGEEPILQWAESLPPNDRYQLAVVNDRRELVYPPPVLDVPAPQAIEITRFTSEQSNLWSQFQAAQFVQHDAAKAIDASDRFARTGVPERWSAQLAYDAAMMLKANGQWREALERLAPLATNAVGNLSEGGIPLRQLALLQMGTLALEGKDQAQAVAAKWTNNSPVSTNASLTAANVSGWIPEIWNRLCLATIQHPTVLSEYFLNQALDKAQGHDKEAITSWLRVWQSHQISREAYRRLIQADAHRSGAIEWLSDNEWVGYLHQSGATNGVLFAQTKHDVNRGIGEILGKMGAESLPSHIVRSPVRGRNSMADLNLQGIPEAGLIGIQAPVRIPPYLGVMITLDGAAEPELLRDYAPLVERDSARGLNYVRGDRRIISKIYTPFDFKLAVFLEDPAALYSQQRRRALIFGSLIGVSAIAALIGFFAARRAFHRQLYLSEMKSNFVSSVSHELRAPIASVRLMAEGLERGKIQDPAKQNEYFRFIVQECRRLSSLIENVLDFSRIEQGRKQYEFEPTDAVALVRQTVTLMETYAAEQQIQIALQVTGEPTPIEMDGKAMQQALINLLDNAIKHSPKGATISAGLEFSQSPAAMFLWVEDRGEGIPPEEHEKIFERFYRLGSELRRETQGVGIGLSIVKHIVTAHRGKVIVRSSAGQGSRFTIELPMKGNQG